MSSPSNLYAEKIFSEHPTAFWALDDKADYISLISENDRKISLWHDTDPGTRRKVSGGTAEISSFIDEPFPDSVTILLTGDVVEEDFGRIECISPDSLNTSGINFNDLDSDLGTFCIGAYVYSDSTYLSKIEIGYEYYDSTSGINVQKLKTFNTSISEKWLFVSETFDIPSDNTTMRLVLNIEYLSGAASTDQNRFYVNGLSLGQWSEEFNSTSLGSSVVELSETNPLNSFKAIEAKAYGLQDMSGYYLLNSTNSLVAKNSSLPIVYGASNVTMLYPNESSPSLIVPALGLLKEEGKYKQYTLEFWAKISCNSAIERKIVGPLGSSDGIYIRGPFITLKIGNVVGSYDVGEWMRPMLIDFKYSYDSASLLINGEIVIDLSLPDDAHNFVTSFDEENNENLDWIGFYAYADASPIEIDAVAIYPYLVSQVLAKRRFVYGQGVEFPENINTAYSGTSVFIDYPFANYANTYGYPDFGKWNQGIIDNLVVENNTLRLPSYSASPVLFNNKTADQWKTDIQSSQNEFTNFITLRPTSGWASTNGHIFIDDINMVGDTKSFYGVFKQKVANTEDETLFEIRDVSTSNYLKIVLTETDVSYIFKYGSQITEIYSTGKYYVGQEFSVGIDINKFIQNFGGNLGSFFGKRSSLKMYVGGSSDFSNTFNGNIYSVGFSTKRNFSKISQFFSEKGLLLDSTDIFGVDGGIPETQYWIDTYDGNLPSTISWDESINPDSDYPQPALVATTSLIDFVSSYTIKLVENLGEYNIDISTDSYWEDYLPLTYFAKYVKDADNYSHYDLDFIQFNVSVPAPSVFIEDNSSATWTYAELQEKYHVPIQRTYESLDNSLFTGYDNYDDLKNKLFKTYKYDTSSSIVKTYISFQYLLAGANAPAAYFTNSISPDKNGIVIPGSYILDYDSSNNPIYDNFENTRYEVVDNMIIYPPKNVDFNELAIVTHIEVQSGGISRDPIVIKKVQYASQSLNDTTPNYVGTRFGTKIYPYKKSGAYFDYKTRNPFSIYRGSSPYLYLTRNSGIRLRGNYDPETNRGISIPINENKSSSYKVIAAQMAIRYDEDFFPYAPTQIFQIESKKSLINIYMVANSPNGKRAKLYAINAKTGKIENGIAFYWNGKIVKDPNITIKEWGMLGIAFSNSLDFENFAGAIRITGPLLVNTVSHYKSTNLQEVQQVTKRPWVRVKTSGGLDFDWEYWDTSFIWNGVLVLSSTSYYGVSPEDIYKTYTGTNKIIIDDDRSITLGSYEYRTLNAVSWQTSTLNAV